MLHLETIAPATLDLLRRLQSLPMLAETRLVGGTALALHLGHRVSVDLDIFGRWDYEKDLGLALSKVGRVEKESGTQSGKMAFFYVDDVKVDCVAYEEYAWIDAAVEESGVRLAGVRDIAAMKVNAVTNRGTRKDFVDVARLLDDYPLEEIFGWGIRGRLAPPGSGIRKSEVRSRKSCLPRDGDRQGGQGGRHQCRDGGGGEWRRRR